VRTLPAPRWWPGTEAEWQALIFRRLEESTRASGVPLIVEDPTVRQRIAELVASTTLAAKEAA
jgi:hypothetical protein